MKVGWYAVIVLADNATFLLSVNHMVAFRTQTQNRPHKKDVISLSGSTVEHRARYPEVMGTFSTWVNVFQMFASTSAHAVKTELSSLGLEESTTPILPSLAITL